jgi:hypothetical protein
MICSLNVNLIIDAKRPYICLSSRRGGIFALAYRPHGLICKNSLCAVELMATGSNARAMIFSARGHAGRWGLDFGVKISPSEMHGKIFKRPYLGNGAS